MMFKAVFLDVDGVLVDSEGVFNVCWRRAAELEGYQMSFEQALQLRSLDSSLAKSLFQAWYRDENAYSIIRQRRKELMDEYNRNNKLMAKPGVKAFLEKASSNPITVAIVTSSPKKRISDYLSSVGIDLSLFDAIITTEQVKNGKPYPDVYNYACKIVGYYPSECIAVEDSPNGVKSAHAAGCYTVMVPDLSPVNDDLKDYVDKVVNSLDDLDL